MSKVKFISSGPKRKIDRVMSRLVITLSQTQANTIVFTPDDPVTLVRALFRGHIGPTADNTVCISEVCLNVAPNGQVIIDAVAPSTVSLDQAVPNEEIFRLQMFGSRQATATYQLNEYIVDTKAMRKIRKSDVICFSNTRTSDGAGVLFGILYLWFKEA